MLPNITVIVPSYNPDEKLGLVVSGLLEAGFDDIVVVNDGSKDCCVKAFDDISSLEHVTVLTHEVNKGKGVALKTAFNFVKDRGIVKSGVITVDGDNQHTVKDIIACSKALEDNKDKVIIGCRDFSGKDVPPRSKFGNNMTKFVFRLFCGIKISDTQTGLRAIPYQYLQDFINMDGDRYEYETNMLLEMKRLGFDFIEVPIQTVYIEENQTSHFNPIKDSIKIYRVIFGHFFKFGISAIASFLIDIGIFNIVYYFTKKSMDVKWAIGLSTFVARAISSIFNFTVNKEKVFKSDASVKESIWKYYVLAVCQLILSTIGVYGISKLLRSSKNNFITSVIKICVDVTLFFMSYNFQKKWVFKSKDKKRG